MKKILNGPTVWRAKCPVCDCEFEYDSSETLSIFNKNSDHSYFKVVICPSCKSYINYLILYKSFRIGIYRYRNENGRYYDNITN